MDFFYLAVLSIIQGATEFLPVSSQAHLILLAKLAITDLGPSIEVAAHAGSLVAIMLYFKQEVMMMLKGVAHSLARSQSDEARLLHKVVIASIPVVVVGLVIKLTATQEHIRSVDVIAGSTIFFGILLWLADNNKAAKTLNQLSLKEAFWIGLFQCFALIPGASRSGVTMTMGRFLGLSATASARFSLLLAMPALAGAVVLTAITEPSLAFSFQSLVVVGLSFLSSLAAVALMLSWLKRAGFGIFVVYRLLLGLVLLTLF